MKNTTATVTTVQEQYIETVNAGMARWSHRKDGGHSGRIRAGAYRKAVKQLQGLGFTDQKQIDTTIQDARDMAALVRIAEEA